MINNLFRCIRCPFQCQDPFLKEDACIIVDFPSNKDQTIAPTLQLIVHFHLNDFLLTKSLNMVSKVLMSRKCHALVARLTIDYKSY